MERWYNNKWFLLFIMIPFFKPICLQYFSGLLVVETIFVIWKMIGAFLIGLQLLNCFYYHLEIPRLVIAVSLFEGSILLSTIFHLGYLQRAVIDAVSIVAFVAFFVWALQVNGKVTLSLLGKILSVLMIMNLISEIVYPYGLPADLYYHNEVNPLYFMTIDNGSALFLMFCILIFVIEIYVFGESVRKQKAFLIICCFLSAILSHSRTAMGMVFVQIALLSLIYWNKGLQNISWKKWWKVYSIAAVCIVLIAQSNILKLLISSISSYDSVLTGRSLLWNTAVDKIAKHFFFGYGRSTQDYIPAWGGYFSSHNFWLELLLQGGMIALILFFIGLFKCLQNLDKWQQFKLVRSGIVTYFVMMSSAMMESAVHSVYIFGTMVFLYCCESFCPSKAEKNVCFFHVERKKAVGRKKVSKPYVSIIVPIYNGQDYVKDLVTSIVNQQTKEMELIIVDDGSIDHTLEYCMELKEKYAWVNVIHTENKGVSHARNVGLENAHGKWIHFVDADDQLSEGMYDAFMQKINQTFPDVMVCGCNRVYTGTNESTICGPIEDAVIEKEGISEFFKQVDMERRFWLLDYIWNKWYRRDLIERYHIRFNESLSLGEDFVFNTQYFQHVTKMALSSEHFYQYLIRENGLVSKFREKPWEGREQLYRAHRELYQSMNLLESMEKQIQIQAGQIAFGDVKTINSPKCFYDRNEKIEFVRGMLHSSQYEWILTYLKNKGERSILYKGYDWMFSKGRASLIADIFWIEKKVREFLEI